MGPDGSAFSAPTGHAAQANVILPFGVSVRQGEGGVPVGKGKPAD